MSDAIAQKLSYGDFREFLAQYHQYLHEHENFPPLGAEKALNTAAKSMGLKNKHVLNNWPPHSPNQFFE